MARVACLLLPELPLAAMLRLEPELHGRAVGIVESTRRGQRETILAGWMRGLTLAQARSAQPDLEVRPLSLEAIQAARDALLDVARSISPRIQETRPGVAHIDLEGTGALFRHIKITEHEQLDQAALSQLLGAATKHLPRLKEMKEPNFRK